MNALIARAYAHWEEVHGQYPQWIPFASAPVLWFGDRTAYEASATRVLTVGVNPGPLTFPEVNLPDDNPWKHYPALAHGQPQAGPYQVALNQAPLDKWFSTWDAVLAPLDAIHPRKGRPPLQNRPLHLDLSPLMTRPEMSSVEKVCAPFARGLIASGVPILAALIQILKPHHTFISVKAAQFDVLAQHTAAQRVGGGAVDRHEASRYTWNLPGELFWFRRTNIPAISVPNTLRQAVGQWAAGGSEPDWGALPAGNRKTLDELVEFLRACLEDPDGDCWNKRGLKRPIKIWAPNGAPAHLSSQSNPARIREFLDHWDGKDPTVRTQWGRKPAKKRVHVTLGELAHHIKGLHLSWGDP